jgi:hypothetical protein
METNTTTTTTKHNTITIFTTSTNTKPEKDYVKNTKHPGFTLFDVQQWMSLSFCTSTELIVLGISDKPTQPEKKHMHHIQSYSVSSAFNLFTPFWIELGFKN